MNNKKKRSTYEIVGVDEEKAAQYCVCLEDWSDEMKDAGDHKACWYEKMKDRGLGIKMVRDDDGILCGMIQYVPAEFAPMTGEDFYFIYCTWVHGHKPGPGNRQGRGMGTALLEAAEKDIAARGAKGIAAWGLLLPIWMKASWYKKHGYKIIQREGIKCLMWKSLTNDAVEPEWYKPNIPKAPREGRVRVLSIRNGICPAMNIPNERARKVAAAFGDDVVFQEVVTYEPEVLREWGVSDALYLNDREIPIGPPLPEEKLKRLISKELKKAGRNRRT